MSTYDVSHRDRKGRTALMMYAETGVSEKSCPDHWLVRRLIELRTNVNVTTDDENPANCSGQSALSLAMSTNYSHWGAFAIKDPVLLTSKLMLMKLIIDGGANVNLADTRGNTPLLNIALLVRLASRSSRYGETREQRVSHSRIYAKMAMMLIDAGASLGHVNLKNQSFVDQFQSQPEGGAVLRSILHYCTDHADWSLERAESILPTSILKKCSYVDRTRIVTMHHNVIVAIAARRWREVSRKTIIMALDLQTQIPADIINYIMMPYLEASHSSPKIVKQQSSSTSSSISSSSLSLDSSDHHFAATIDMMNVSDEQEGDDDDGNEPAASSSSSDLPSSSHHHTLFAPSDPPRLVIRKSTAKERAMAKAEARADERATKRADDVASLLATFDTAVDDMVNREATRVVKTGAVLEPMSVTIEVTGCGRTVLKQLQWLIASDRNDWLPLIRKRTKIGYGRNVWYKFIVRE